MADSTEHLRLDLLVNHQLLLRPATVYEEIFGHPRGVSWATAATNIARSPWHTTFHTIPNHKQIDLVKRLLHGTLTASPLAVHTGVTNQQHANTDLDTPRLSINHTALPVLSRSHALILNDFGFACVTFQFTLDTSSVSPADLDESINKIMTDRKFYLALDQCDYVNKTLSLAADEVDNTLECIIETRRTTSNRNVRRRIWRPTDLDLPNELSDRKSRNPWFDTGYPWILSSGFSLPATISKWFTSREGPVLPSEEYRSLGHFTWAGQSVGLVHVDSPATTTLTLLPQVCARLQMQYYSRVQLSRVLHTIVSSPSSLQTTPRRDLARFNNVSLVFERMILDIDSMQTSLSAALKPVADGTSLSWRLTSMPATRMMINAYRDFTRSEHGRRMLSATRREQYAIILIAMLQLLTLSAAFAGLPSLFDLKQTVPLLAPEEWLLTRLPMLSRVMVVLAICLAFAVFGPIAIRSIKDAFSTRRYSLPRRTKVAIHRRDLDTRQFRIRPSLRHGLGMWANISFQKGDLVYAGPLGKKVEGTERPQRANGYLNCEWNASANNVYYVRNPRGPYSYINHSRAPNVHRVIDEDRGTLRVVAIKTIHENDEILLDYRAEPLEPDYLVDRGGYL